MAYSSRTKATLNYTNNALERIAAIIVSPHEQEVYDALQIIKAHHGGNRAGAVKAAIVAYAEKLKAQD